MSEIAEMTLVELAAGLEGRRFSSREIADTFLARIAKADGKLHSFVEVYAKEARALADAADAARAAGLPLPALHGLPIAIKDLCDIKGRVGTGGSQMLAQRVATETSATVERLLAAGMVPLGKTHMVEFAFGGWGTNPLMGAPWNPWDLKTQRTPGGSSSGTGVAVAARLAPAGIGSDTGGSVRIPSAFNGLVGLKVTFGRISLHGTMLLSWTLDSIGPMARSVEDCALITQALVGPDPRDASTLGQPLEDFVAAASSTAGIAGMRIALPDAAQLPDFMHADVVANWQKSARTFESLGARIETVKLPGGFFDLSMAAGSIVSAEAYSLHRAYIEDETTAIGPHVRARVRTAKGYPTGQYAEELRRLAKQRAEFTRWFAPYDALLLPTVAVPALDITTHDEMGPIPGYLTRPGNYLGLCGLAMPSGFSDGLPTGVQILGKPYAETTVLRAGKAFQDATSFHKAKPDLSAVGL
ncbi:MAG: amidase [Reyranellaceae bacterium]